MPNSTRIFLTKLIIFFYAFLQSFNCQADISKLQIGDSLFNTKNYQEALEVYEDLLEKDGSFSPSMLLKMAFIAEGKGDFGKGSFYLAKYYDYNPNPRVITKIKSLTEQANLIGYEFTDGDRFWKFLTELQMEITALFAVLLFISLILLFVFRRKVDNFTHYLPTAFLIILVFISNNFLKDPPTGIVTGTPTLIMDSPTAGGNLINSVDPGHRVTIKSSKDIWYEIEWGNETAFVKKENISDL